MIHLRPQVVGKLAEVQFASSEPSLQSSSMSQTQRCEIQRLLAQRNCPLVHSAYAANKRNKTQVRGEPNISDKRAFGEYFSVSVEQAEWQIDLND